MVSKIRVLVAKPGLDGHDRGAKVLARSLRDAGMEVIYTGIKQTPQSIVDAAIEEDVDCIDVSILSGAHRTLFPEIMVLLKKRKAKKFLLIAGGIIPDDDISAVKKMGFKGVFGPGIKLSEVAEFITKNVRV